MGPASDKKPCLGGVAAAGKEIKKHVEHVLPHARRGQLRRLGRCRTKGKRQLTTQGSAQDRHRRHTEHVCKQKEMLFLLRAVDGGTDVGLRQCVVQRREVGRQRSGGRSPHQCAQHDLRNKWNCGAGWQGG